MLGSLTAWEAGTARQTANYVRYAIRPRACKTRSTSPNLKYRQSPLLRPIESLLCCLYNSLTLQKMEPASSAPASNGDIMEEVGTGKDAGKLKQAPSTSAAAAALDAMRAYRACLHCRSRKTKCNLDVNGGKPVSVTLHVLRLPSARQSCRHEFLTCR